jgi:co-chaperonin GroES (HSP10)
MPPSLILPKSTAMAVMDKRQSDIADSIQRSSINQLTSDDFVTVKEVERQIIELREYIEDRRQVEPEYRLPHPAGWRVSVLMLTVPEVTDGGVHIVDEMREARGMASPQGIVLALGQGAFQDRSRFTINGELAPWLKVGDRVIWKKYDVTTFQIGNGQRLGFMNDTQAVATIDGDWIVPV